VAGAAAALPCPAESGVGAFASWSVVGGVVFPSRASVADAALADAALVDMAPTAASGVVFV
jgi:hypothetical protein